MRPEPPPPDDIPGLSDIEPTGYRVLDEATRIMPVLVTVVLGFSVVVVMFTCAAVFMVGVMRAVFE